MLLGGKIQYKCYFECCLITKDYVRHFFEARLSNIDKRHYLGKLVCSSHSNIRRKNRMRALLCLSIARQYSITFLRVNETRRSRESISSALPRWFPCTRKRTRNRTFYLIDLRASWMPKLSSFDHDSALARATIFPVIISSVYKQHAVEYADMWHYRSLGIQCITAALIPWELHITFMSNASSALRFAYYDSMCSWSNYRRQLRICGARYVKEVISLKTSCRFMLVFSYWSGVCEN